MISKKNPYDFILHDYGCLVWIQKMMFFTSLHDFRKGTLLQGPHTHSNIVVTQEMKHNDKFLKNWSKILQIITNLEGWSDAKSR